MAGAKTPKHLTRTTTLNDWIQRESIPFSFDSSKALNGAIDKMISSLSDTVELLGFGEALHGGEDILILRNRLYERARALATVRY